MTFLRQQAFLSPQCVPYTSSYSSKTTQAEWSRRPEARVDALTPGRTAPQAATAFGPSPFGSARPARSWCRTRADRRSSRDPCTGRTFDAFTPTGRHRRAQLQCAWASSPLHAEFVRKPSRSVVVSGTQRSGTTLLCWGHRHRGAWATGRAPARRRPRTFRSRRRVLGGESAQNSMACLIVAATSTLVYQMGTTPNGVFGLKLMWNYLP